jgi:CRISPR-associated exonuclease Cas4
MGVEIYLDVTSIKQYLYCPRIPYFLYVVPIPRKITAKMEMGKEEHEIVQELEERRILKKYGLENGERMFRVRLSSPKLRLSGILDMLIISNQSYFPVEFKFSSNKPYLNHKYQLAAYALLVEDRFNVPVRQGFLYFHPARRIYAIKLTQGVKDYTKILLKKLWGLIIQGKFPEGSRLLSHCCDCEYFLYCGDR